MGATEVTSENIEWSTRGYATLMGASEVTSETLRVQFSFINKYLCLRLMRLVEILMEGTVSHTLSFRSYNFNRWES